MTHHSKIEAKKNILRNCIEHAITAIMQDGDTINSFMLKHSQTYLEQLRDEEKVTINVYPMQQDAERVVEEIEKSISNLNKLIDENHPD